MNNLIKLPLLAVSLLLLATSVAQADICRVKTLGDGGLATNTGSSWGAAKTLQAALADTTCDEIWVKSGVYTPTQPSNPPNIIPEDRLVSFSIDRPLKLYGSFNGNETSLSQRHPSASNRSVLSGDLLGDDPNSGGVNTEQSLGTSNDNSEHVLVIGGTDEIGNGEYTKENTVIDGFAITAGVTSLGYQVGSPTNRNFGAGLFCNGRGNLQNQNNECSPTLNNLWFAYNRSIFGAGIYFACEDYGTCAPEIRNTTFTGNRANLGGGGIAMSCSSLSQCAANLFTSTLNHNSSDSGSAIYVSGGGNLVVLNTTFADNDDYINGTGAIYLDTAHIQLLGSIMWGNSPTNFTLVNSGSTTIQNSVIQGGCPANTGVCDNVLTTPPFLSSANVSTGFAPSYSLGEGSSAIDNGDQPNCPGFEDNFLYDQRGNTRPFDGDGDGVAKCDAGSVEMHNSPTYQVVNTTIDTYPPQTDGKCSLREAIDNATENQLLWPDCSVGGLSWTDTISFDPTVFTNESTSTIELAFAELSIENPTNFLTPGLLVIDGTRGDGGRVNVRAANNARVLRVNMFFDNSPVQIHNLQISGGRPSGISYGGGVYLENGRLVLEDCLIDDNVANNGGGIYVGEGAEGTGKSLTMRRCTVTGNSVSGNGGGIYVDNALRPVLIDASTISGNTAGPRGGGLSIDTAEVVLNQSTVSSNALTTTAANGTGIGIYVTGVLAGGATPLTINHSTIAQNDGTASNVGTGLYVAYQSSASVNASVIAAHSGNDGCAIYNGAGTALEATNSHFEQGTGCVTIDGGNNTSGNPYLYGLEDNGGPTWTHLPRWHDSPLVDAVVCNSITDPDFDISTDQRGTARPQDGNRNGDSSMCDIGAVEVIGDAFTLTLSPYGLGTVNDNMVPKQIEDCEQYGNGTCTGTYPESNDLVLTATPGIGRHLTEWSGDCSGTELSITVPMHEDMNCSVTFDYNYYTITAGTSGGNGSISPTTQEVRFGQGTHFTLLPDAGYQVANVIGDTCSPSEDNGSWSVGNITEDCNVTASFVAVPDLHVTASAPDGNGSITPASQNVPYADHATFTVTANSGFEIAAVTGDTCTPVDNNDGTWTASNITADCTVTASFAALINELFEDGFESPGEGG